MELRHLRYFVAAAEEGHFGRAAQRLNISAPALSLQIRDLESETGVELFERLPRGVRLTRAGEAFLGETRGVLASLEEGIARAQSVARGKSGVLRVGHVPPVLRQAEVASRVIPTFLSRFPDIDVQAVQATMDAQIAALREGALDVAIAYAPAGENFGFKIEVLYPGTASAAIIPASHALARHTVLRWSDLTGLPWLTSARNTNRPLMEMFVHELHKRGLDVRPDEKLDVTDPAVLLDLVAAGAGWMFGSLNGALGRTGVVSRTLEGLPIATPCVALWRDDAESSITADFLALARELRDTAISSQRVTSPDQAPIGSRRSRTAGR